MVERAPRYHSIHLRAAAGVLGMMALLVAWQVFGVQRRDLREVEQVAVEQLTHDMTLLQSTLEYALAAGDVEQANRELTARGADPSIELLVLVDDAGRVLGSTLRHQVGRPLEALVGEVPPADMTAAALERQVGSTRLSGDERRVLAIWPVVLGMEEGRIHADRVGMLVEVYSLDRARAVVLERLWSRTLELAVGGVVGAAVLLAFGNLLVGRRVRMLVAATERFSAGDLDARAAVPGSDELTRIGVAFDAMAARVGETQRAIAESEARFRALVELAPVGIVQTDPAGRIVASNVAWRKMVGADGTWPGAVHPEDRAGVEREWADARAAGRQARAECRLLRPDGQVVWIQALGVPGRVQSIVAAVDMTERRRAEETRRLLEARLQQMQKLEAIGSVAGGVAHDFNNVLASIYGSAELLSLTVEGPEPARRHVQQILRAAERGRGLVRQVLSFGSAEPKRLREVRLDVLLDEVARFLGPSLPVNVAVRVEVAPDTPPIVADPDQLHRLLVNLGTNAWQAMRPRGGLLELKACPVRIDDERRVPGVQPGPAVRIDVRDEGVGMDAETRARIFEPFFTTKPPGEGTGLGLPVVHGIVRAHGGGILVSSEPGRGSTFSIVLPVSLPKVEPGVAAVRLPHAPATPSSVLYVDDDDFLLELAEGALRRAGFRVTAYSRPDEALAAFRAAPDAFDLVVTDQQMPGMLGEELMVALRNVRSDLPVVVLSGYVTNGIAARVRAMGARAIVEKPMSVDGVVDVCKRALAEAVRPETPRLD